MSAPKHEQKRPHAGYSTIESLVAPSVLVVEASPHYEVSGLADSGIGAENIAYNPPPMGRETRQTTPLNTHDGEAQRPTDYGHPGEVGFRFRARHKGV